MAYYNGDKPGAIPGLLPPSAVGSYNWWEAGALWGQVSYSLSDISST
jgi:mannan endo-1,6-alpha-mannosidase